MDFEFHGGEVTYLNHAGTSWPKPVPVQNSVQDAQNSTPSQWPDLFRASHQTVAEFFHVERSRLLLTPSCTAALELAIMDQEWKPGDRVLTTHFEHHALFRHLIRLKRLEVEVVQVEDSNDSLISLDALQTELQSGNVKLVAMTAACNVTGLMLPIEKVVELAHQFGARVLIDGAQVAGWLDLDLQKLGVDLFTFAGHKGPQAPWGIGGLFVSDQMQLSCPNAVCEVRPDQKATELTAMPGYCDAGSANLVALAGLAAGCDWLNDPGQSNRLARARQQAEELANAFRQIDDVVLHHDVTWENRLPTVAVSFGARTKQVFEQLRSRQVVVSYGFQCAPEAHRALGTSQSGIIRFSIGPAQPDLEMLNDIVRRLATAV